MEMKKCLILALTLLPFLASAIVAQEPKPGKEGSLQNFETMGKTNAQILAILGKANKPGFLYFTTDWCGWCKVLEKETFGNSEFKHYLEVHFVPFLIDAEKNTGPELNNLYKIGAYPTVVIINPQGVVIDKMTGYDKPEPYFKRLKDVFNGIDTLERLEKDYESDPDNETKAIALANRYLSSYDYTSAKPILEKLLLASKNMKEMPNFLFGLGQYYHKRESPQGAPFLERIIREFPDYPQMELVYRALEGIYGDDPHKRIDLLENEIKKGVDKDHIDNARVSQAMDSVALKEWNNALAYLEKISTAFNPGFPAVPLLRSYCLMQIGKEKEGQALLDKLYSESNLNSQKRLELIGGCLELKIYLKEALKWIEPMVAQDNGKTNNIILYCYARLLALNGEKQKALGLMEKAVGMTSEGRDRTIMNKELDKLRKELEKK